MSAQANPQANPIVRRLETLAVQWVDFTEQDEARILCWLIEPDEFAMVDAFLAMEAEEDTAMTPDLFVSLSSPFVFGGYGEALLREFVEKAAALHAGLEDPTFTEWSPPALKGDVAEPGPFLIACDDFAVHYQLPGRLVLVLSPTQMTDEAAFAKWLTLVADAGLPNLPRLRIVVRDDAREPRLSELTGHPHRVSTVRANLDMPSARLEISETAGRLDEPFGQYRHSFVQLTNALSRGDLAGAEPHAQAALAIAAAQNWPAMAVPILMAMAGSLAAAGDLEQAHQRYTLAEGAAADGEKASDPVCPKLRVQARLGRGSVLVQAGAWKLAAELYAETVSLALAINDSATVIDCHRLASLCREQDGQFETAWQHAVDGLGYARTLDAGTLGSTTLAFLGESFARLCKRTEFNSSWPRVDAEFTRLLGPDWRPKFPGASA